MKQQTKHKKHADISRPDLGNFARQEFALIGTPCGEIQALSRKLIDRLSGDFKMAYVDADHSSADEASSDGLTAKASLIYTDKIGFHRFDLRAEMNTFHYRHWFNNQDLVLVNGNHFQARRQLVFIDPRKFDSLQRKLDRLTQVVGFIKLDAGQEIPGFLQEHISDWATLPVWTMEEVEKISGFLREHVRSEIPSVKGLILAGGKSQRMGRDKGQLQYHGRPQREHSYRLMSTDLDISAFLSCRADQVPEMPDDHDLIVDSFVGLGPFGAILSAFREHPNHAWLVMACDLPFVDKAGLDYLLANRDASAIATAFHNPATGFPDPLLTLWEPRAYPILLQFLAQGYSCPRKVLINSPVHVIHPPNEQLLTNVNSPAEFEKAKTTLSKINP